MRVVVLDESSLVLDVVRAALQLVGIQATCARSLADAGGDADWIITDEPLGAPAFRLDKLRGIADFVTRFHSAASLDCALPDLMALKARFRPSLADVAQRRISRAVELLNGGTPDPEQLTAELRLLVGEASLVGEHRLAQQAAELLTRIGAVASAPH